MGSQLHGPVMWRQPRCRSSLLREKCQTNHAIANLCDQEVPLVRGRTRHTRRREIRTFDDAVSWTSWEREQEANVSLALLSHLSTNENKNDRRNHADWGDFPPRASNHITHHEDPGRYIQALHGRRERSDLPRERRTALDMIRGAAIQTPSFSADHAGMPSRTRECMPSPRHQPACAFPRARGRCCSKRPPNSDKRRRR